MADPDAEIAKRQRALDEAEKSGGPLAFEAINARTELAFAYNRADLHALGTPLLERVVRDLDSTVGPQHKNAVVARKNLANNYYGCQRYADALGAYRQAADHSATVNGPRDIETVECRSSAAYCLLRLHRFGEAIDAYQRVLADWEAGFKPSHHTFLMHRLHHARALDAAGHTQRAMALYESLLSDSRPVLGFADSLPSGLARNLTPPPRPWQATAPLSTHQLWVVGLSSLLDARGNHNALWTLYPSPWLDRDNRADGLKRDWGIESRDDLLGILQWLAAEGHRMELAETLGHPAVSWDISRYAFCVRNGFAAEYIDEPEAWELLSIVAEPAFASYGSWKEFGEDYLAGRMSWLGARGGEPEEYPTTSQLQTVNALGRLLDPANEGSPWNLAPWDAVTRPDEPVAYPPSG